MKPHRCLPLLVLLLLLAPATLARQAQFLPLGELPGGASSSNAKGVSGDGFVVVGSSIGAGSQPFEAFRWRAGSGMTSLGALAGGNLRSDAYGVNEAGSVVVGVSDSTAGLQAFRWTVQGGMVGLGDLMGGTFSSEARGVSADGLVVVGFGDGVNGTEAFRWTSAGGMVGLGDLAGGLDFSSAQGVSADGDVVVGASAAASNEIAFRWDAVCGMVGLGFLPGDVRSIATGASGDGSVVVGSSRSPTGTWQAFFWTSGTGMVGLGLDTQAAGVSADGTTVVGRDLSVPGSRAWVWTAALGLVDLQNHLVAQGATGLAGWTLREARAVSADGNAISGLGANPSGSSEAWLAYLAPPGAGTIGSSYCGPAIPNSSGQPGVITAGGSVLVSDDDVTLVASQLPPGQFGYFLAGQTQGLFNPPNSQGLICLTGNIGRYNQVANIIQGPMGSIPITLGAIPVNPPQAVQPGETWSFQCWFRDNNPTLTSNFTDGVMIAFQ